MGPTPLLRPPAHDVDEVATYVANPREKRSFHTVLDAAHLFGKDGRTTVTTRSSQEGGERAIEVRTEHALLEGSIVETLELRATGELELRSRSLHRRVMDRNGEATREERVAFTKGPLPLPEAVYPEVMLPFVLRWQPFDGHKRPLYAWIVDRFVARVYCEWVGKGPLRVPAGKFEALEMIMFPDLNDWVSMGTMLSTLAKPLLPKYRMWFEANDARKVLRFEGPYGPPGAPELVLEMV